VREYVEVLVDCWHVYIGQLSRKLAIGNLIADDDNMLIFGLRGVGNTHAAISLRCKIVERGYAAPLTQPHAKWNHRASQGWSDPVHFSEYEPCNPTRTET
jgi:hypothetical protein